MEQGDVTDDPSDTSFHKALRLSLGTLAIVDLDAAYFTRVWCCYEVPTSYTLHPTPCILRPA